MDFEANGSFLGSCFDLSKRIESCLGVKTEMEIESFGSKKSFVELEENLGWWKTKKMAFLANFSCALQ